jgi:predicted nucleotidyltransferase
MGGEAFSTRILDQAKQEKQRKREDERVKVLKELKLALSESPISLREAFIFGTVAIPFAFNACSDVDVAVHAQEPRGYFLLKCYLEGRLGREVDLVELESCRFIDSIRRQGIRWTKNTS